MIKIEHIYNLFCIYFRDTAVFIVSAVYIIITLRAIVSVSLD